MATYTWSIPSEEIINGQTYIKDTDNKLQNAMNDLQDYVNGEGDHLGQGLTYDLVDKLSSQTITGTKTFTNGLAGNLTGNVTGNLTGNSDTATKLATSRTISLIGDVTGSVSFDGSSNISLDAAVADDSHNHIISNVDGLQTALDAKQNTIVSGTHIKTVNGVNIVGSGNVNIPNATETTYGTIKAYVSGSTLYITL